ncbi:hypothetical protein [Hyphococcus sp.]|uniref:hypothetical protein n=1 Tax=Hyphococcus sp. TaxID=2038636 RepID=UPI003CCC1373
MSIRATVAFLVTALAFVLLNTASAEEENSPINALMGDLVRGEEWLTPNPDYEPGGQQPKDWGVRYRWGPYKQHVTGELFGVFLPSDDSSGGETREVQYWTLYAFYNPVTKMGSALQVNWTGSFADGDMYLDDTGRLVMDQTFFGVDGSAKEVRHLFVMDESGESHSADVYEKNESGEWVKMRDWVWTRKSSQEQE